MPSIRPVPYGILVELFEQEGFALNRQRGDHLIYVKPGLKRPLVIPMYTELPGFIIKNLLETSGITRERYFQIVRNL